MKFIKYSRQELQTMSTEKLISLYKATKQERLKLAYELKFNMQEEIEHVKKLIIQREEELQTSLRKAEQDREEAFEIGASGYNIALLSNH